MQQSMSHKGNCWDNAPTERLIWNEDTRKKKSILLKKGLIYKKLRFLKKTLIIDCHKNKHSKINLLQLNKALEFENEIRLIINFYFKSFLDCG